MTWSLQIRILLISKCANFIIIMFSLHVDFNIFHGNILSFLHFAFIQWKNMQVRNGVQNQSCFSFTFDRQNFFNIFFSLQHIYPNHNHFYPVMLFGYRRWNRSLINQKFKLQGIMINMFILFLWNKFA